MAQKKRWQYEKCNPYGTYPLSLSASARAYKHGHSLLFFPSPHSFRIESLSMAYGSELRLRRLQRKRFQISGTSISIDVSTSFCGIFHARTRVLASTEQDEASTTSKCKSRTAYLWNERAPTAPKLERNREVLILENSPSVLLQLVELEAERYRYTSEKQRQSLFWPYKDSVVAVDLQSKKKVETTIRLASHIISRVVAPHRKGNRAHQDSSTAASSETENLAEERFTTMSTKLLFGSWASGAVLHSKISLQS